MPRKCTDAVCATHEFATYLFDGNRTITTVVNYPPLQRWSRLGTFEAFLRRRAFTHTYWMLPHPECFFDWLLDKTRPFCVDTRRYHADPARIRAYEAVLGRNRVGEWRAVIPWHGTSGNETRAVELATPLVRIGVCATSTCAAPSFPYHLCMPGATSHLWPIILLAS
jgi:hypothetical protein